MRYLWVRGKFKSGDKRMENIDWMFVLYYVINNLSIICIYEFLKYIQRMWTFKIERKNVKPKK